MKRECLNNFYVVSEAHILNEQATSPLKIIMKISQNYSITIEKLLLIFNGFVHILRLALKPPAAFLKSDVRSMISKNNS
jgi:hypothetical protein